MQGLSGYSYWGKRLQITIVGEGNDIEARKDNAQAPGITLDSPIIPTLNLTNRYPEFALDAPVAAKLILSHPPEPYDTAELAWSITSSQDIENAVASIRFRCYPPSYSWQTPQGVALIEGGTIMWKGPLEKDVPVAFTAEVEFGRPGDWEISLSYADSGGSKINYEPIYLNTTRSSGNWGWQNPTNFPKVTHHQLRQQISPHLHNTANLTLS